MLFYLIKLYVILVDDVTFESKSSFPPILVRSMKLGSLPHIETDCHASPII